MLFEPDATSFGISILHPRNDKTDMTQIPNGSSGTTQSTPMARITEFEPDRAVPPCAGRVGRESVGPHVVSRRSETVNAGHSTISTMNSSLEGYRNLGIMTSGVHCRIACTLCKAHMNRLLKTMVAIDGHVQDSGGTIRTHKTSSFDI